MKRILKAAGIPISEHALCLALGNSLLGDKHYVHRYHRRMHFSLQRSIIFAAVLAICIYIDKHYVYYSNQNNSNIQKGYITFYEAALYHC